MNFKSIRVFQVFFSLTLTFLVMLVSSFDEKDEERLFKIHRSKDKNQIFYDLKQTKNGLLDIKEPINIYWIRTSEPTKKDPLSWIQRKYAYGLHYLSITEDEAKFQFVSYSKRDLVLKKNKHGKFKVFIEYNKKWVELNRIFIQIDGGSFWFPKISRLELHCKDPITDKNVIEIVHP